MFSGMFDRMFDRTLDGTFDRMFDGTGLQMMTDGRVVRNFAPYAKYQGKGKDTIPCHASDADRKNAQYFTGAVACLYTCLYTCLYACLYACLRERRALRGCARMSMRMLMGVSTD